MRQGQQRPLNSMGSFRARMFFQTRLKLRRGDNCILHMATFCIWAPLGEEEWTLGEAACFGGEQSLREK